VKAININVCEILIIICINVWNINIIINVLLLILLILLLILIENVILLFNY